jgi:DUF4097 and DUF4098 domain-containing protein YvlB
MRGTALVALALAASCGGRTLTLSRPELEAEVVRTQPIDLDGSSGLVLDLSTHAGDVTVEVAEGPPRLVATLRLMARTEAEADRLLDGFSVTGHAENDSFVVRLSGEAAALPGTDLRLTPLVSFQARVPPGQRLRAESGSGNVEVKGAAGDCALLTAFGDVKVSGVRAESVRARTSSGTVHIEDVHAKRIEVHTSFGDVRVEGVRGDLDVETGSGDVVLVGFTQGSCDLETGFGNIDARGSFLDLTAKTSSGRVGVLAEPGSAIGRPWSLQSSFGDVEVRVPQGFDCDVFAETSFGCVTSDVAVRREGQPSDQRVRGALGDGGGRLTLRTSSGDIRIRAN